MNLNVLMKVGYQGVKNCYSYQVLDKYLQDIKPVGYNNFDIIFEKLFKKEIDFAVLPVENSLGGSIFANSFSSQNDLFYKYNIRIHYEFHLNINHSLYSLNDNVNKLSTVFSHQQALNQCQKNIKKLNLEPKEYWDTMASVDLLIEKNDKSIACIAPPNIKNDKLNELIKNFNDDKNNITRFYLVGVTDKFPVKYLRKNLVTSINKFSGYFVAKDEIGILYDYLEKLKKNNINLTKIESRPYLGTDRVDFSYIFYLEGKYKDKIELDNFNFFGKFPILKIKNSMKIGIIGFGRFGQFIGEKMVKYGFEVDATSRSDYFDLAKDIGINYYKKKEFIENKYDIVILATSILSFRSVLESYPKEFFKDVLIVDVLSVKEYPERIIDDYFQDMEYNLLLTHPMFGPDSASVSWVNKNFVYNKSKVKDNKVVKLFLKFWEDSGCNMIEMDSDNHDMLTANSQFLTHFIGRTLESLNCSNTNVDTDGYKSLVTIKNHSINDSWDLFYALAKYNSKSIETMSKLKYKVNELQQKILYPDGKIIKQSATGKVYSKILELNRNGKDIINAAIGVPSWYPELEYSSKYSSAKGNIDLLGNLVKYYDEKHKVNINVDNLIVTSGAKPSLFLVFQLLTKMETKWLIPKPYWTSYPDIIDLVNGSSIFLDSDDNYNFSLDFVEEYFKDEMVNGLVLCNPNNPTGLLYNENFILDLVDIVKKYNKYLIVDEVYLALTDKRTLYRYNYDKIIIVSSFAKYWAVPGWRVGWILANPELISKFIKIQSTVFTCAPNAGQEVCNKLLETNFKPDLSVLGRSKNELSEIFISKGWKLKENSEMSMYLFPINGDININDYVEKLLKNGLAVISGEPFGNAKGIRLTLPNDIDTLTKMKDILNNIMH